MPQSDTALLERWQHRGDADAFTELVVRHSGMVFATSRRVLADASEAEDVAQECFLKLADQGANVTHPAAWLHQVAVNGARSHLRSDVRRRERETRFAAEQAVERPAMPPDTRDLLPLIDDAIAALPETLRIPVILRFLEGRTHQAIAEELGISRRAVQKRVERGVDQIRSQLKNRGIPIPVEALLPWMVAELPAPPAPPSLIASLGKHALASPLPVASKAVLLGVSIMAKKITITVIAVAFLGILSLIYVNPGSWSGDWLTGTESGPVEAEQASGTSHPLGAEAQRPEEASAAPAATPVTAVTSDTRAQTATSAAAEQPPQEEGPTLDPPATISGTVMDDAAFPVLGADVYLEPDNSWPGSRFLAQASTDDEGHYSLEVKDVTDSYRVSATAAGHRMQTQLLPPLKADEHRDSVDFTLPRTDAILRGRVVTEAGQPVADARVELLLTRQQRPQAIAQYPGRRLAMTVTDQLGQFELGAIQEGLCDVCVLAKNIPPAVFPALPTGDDVHELVLAAGTGAIAGTVTNADGSGAEGYRIMLQPFFMDGGPGIYEYRAESKAALADAAGAYRFEALTPTLMYRVVVFPPEQQAGRMFDARDDVRVRSGAVTQVDFSIVERAKLFGRVTYTDGAPAPDVFYLRACEAAPPGQEVGVVQRISPDGAYEMTVGIRGKDSKAFRLDAAYLVPGTRQYLDANYAFVGGPLIIELAPGDEKRFDITLAPGTSVPVMVTDADGNPLAGMAVGIGVIMPDGLRNACYPGVGLTDASGRCTCPYLDPQLTYYAWVVGSQDNALEPGKAIAESGPVVGAAGETAETVVLIVEDRGGIEGALADDSGSPLVNCPVTLSADTPGGEINASATTDANGYFVIVRALPPGEYASVRLSVAPSAGEPPFVAAVANIEVVGDTIVDVGKVVCQAQQ